MSNVVKLKKRGGVVVQEYDVYIGRRLYMGGWKLEQSKWHNPFTLKNSISVKDAILKYKQYILSKPELLEDLHELKGKTLGCWCKPGPCHGDVLVELVRELAKGIHASHVSCSGVPQASRDRVS